MGIVRLYSPVVGRKKRWAEDMQARFPTGTFDRIEAVLSDNEDRTDFVRDAVDRELGRRERASAHVQKILASTKLSGRD